MHNKKNSIKWHIIIIVFAAIGLLFTAGLYRLEIDTDIVKSLPQGDPVVADGRYVIINHPVQEKIAVNLSCNPDNSCNKDDLVDAAIFIEKNIEKSGLFKSVGMKQFEHLMPELISCIIENLPVMFTDHELEKNIIPLIKPEKIKRAVENNFIKLSGLEGIGQSSFIIHDPLSFRDIVLKKLTALAPSKNSQIYRGHLLSQDGKNLLIPSSPLNPGTDTEQAQKIDKLFKTTENILNKKSPDKFRLSPVGAYRSALDNEIIARRDTERAVTLTTIGIAVMLIFFFPRPYIGLLSLLPAIAGTMLALFVFTFLHDSISILALGFGGAIVSITVDHGIAYLLFIDQPFRTRGREAAKEVWAVGLLAALTTIGAFSFLFISGFPVLTQIGQFAALGIAFSFIFVHTVFPLIFPELKPARTRRTMPFKNAVNKLAVSGGKFKAMAASGLAIFMLFFASPEFKVDLDSMNTVSKETLQAENLIKNTWGDIFNNIYLLTEGSSMKELQEKGDKILSMIEDEIKSNTLSSAFIPSMIFPGEERAKQNLNAWKNFWNEYRINNVKKTIINISKKFGFEQNAFKEFYRLLNIKQHESAEIPDNFSDFLRISKGEDGKNLLMFSTLTPGKLYNPDTFYSKYAAVRYTKIFDPRFFTKKLGELLSKTFIRMVVIISISVIILLLILFFSIRLTLIALLPIGFAMICSLGTLNIINHPLDIPSLMLSIIIIGMGIDYSLFFVRSYQRYLNHAHPSLNIIRTAVFMAAISTLIGFGALTFAEHSLLRSAGLTSLLGIGFSFIGAFTILPPILDSLFKPASLEIKNIVPGSKEHNLAALRHYKLMEPYPRLFARLKIKFDPMFPDLLNFIDSPTIIMDIGCGYGVQSAWLLEIFRSARIYGIDPDPERVRVSSLILGGRGKVFQEKAPRIPETDIKPDLYLLIDILHYINDNDLKVTLQNIIDNIQENGRLIIRATVPSSKKIPWERYLENLRLKLKRCTPFYRDMKAVCDIIRKAGFEIIETRPAKENREETWIIAQYKK